MMRALAWCGIKQSMSATVRLRLGERLARGGDHHVDGLVNTAWPSAMVISVSSIGISGANGRRLPPAAILIRS